jgi:DnaJ-class molecular chaperone
MENYYKTLDVNENASQEDIKKKYRKMSLMYHPDKNPGNKEAEDKFKKISEAYQTIGDEQERKKYDMSRNNPFGQGMGQGMGQGVPPGMNDVFKMFFGGQMPGGVGGFPGGNIRVFHNGQPVNQNNLNKPPPIMKNVVISLEQAYKGDQVPIQIERWLFEDGIRKCENETLYIPIRKGIDDKEIIILREKGNVMDANLKGDVKAIISIQNSSEFRREGLNLYMDKEISLKESLCGFEFIIHHISGKQLRFTNETGNTIKDGLIKSIANYGMERDNHKGSLCVKFTVKHPSKLTNEQIEKLKEIL